MSFMERRAGAGSRYCSSTHENSAGGCRFVESRIESTAKLDCKIASGALMSSRTSSFGTQRKAWRRDMGHILGCEKPLWNVPDFRQFACPRISENDRR